jgi:hypothetical protein
VELEKYTKLTTERSFYVMGDIIAILLDNTVYANFQCSNINENKMILQRALERYNQRARNRCIKNNFEFLHAAKVGESKFTEKILEMSKVKREGIKESMYSFKISIKNYVSVY